MGIGIVVPVRDQRISIEGSVNVKVGIARSRRSNELWFSGPWIGRLSRAHVATNLVQLSAQYPVSLANLPADKKAQLALTLVRG
jgi:hypothetical protein